MITNYGCSTSLSLACDVSAGWAGVYSWLPLAVERLRNIEGVFREDMVAIR